MPATCQLRPNDLYEETYTLQVALFQCGQNEGSPRGSIDARYLAVTYQGAVNAMLAYLDSYPGTDAEAYAATVADILLAGIAAKPAAAAGQRSLRRTIAPMMLSDSRLAAGSCPCRSTAVRGFPPTRFGGVRASVQASPALL